MFDSRGGYLTIPGTSVELFVPPGAIEMGREQEISIQLNYTHESAPKLAEGESLVSPVVTCHPHGLSFKKSVLLSFPHSASGQGYKLKPLISNSDRTDGQSHEFTDLSNTEDGMFLYTEGRCLMLLNHFSDYTVKGESVFAKKLKFMIFADLHDEEEVKIRIWCLDYYSQQEVLETERRLGGTEVDAPHLFTAYTAGGDVQVTVECNNEWQPLKPVLRIQMNRILDHQTCHQTIIITRQKASGRLRLTVRVTQPEHDKSDHVYINASVRVPQSADARHLNTSRCEYTSSNRVLPALPEGLLIAICQLMDPLEPCNRDWRLLADKITRDGKFLIDSDRKLLEQHSKTEVQRTHC
ncbi:netrin receptor UNC5B-like [Ptychodera flava]|uniref:netrin receptor UNC5B-like n=1 Tax=Ptychodera flava TaxID=63121 RepID=UPI00396A39AC